MMGRVIHTSQIVIDLTLRIEAIPEPGGDVFTSESSMTVGDGFNMLAAARRMGVETLYAGPLGEGPFAEAVRRALGTIGVDHAGLITAGDQGYYVTVTNAGAKYTFISTCGTETRGLADALDHLKVSGDDVVCLSDYPLVGEASRVALGRLVGGPTRVRARYMALSDVSPMVGPVPMGLSERLDALGPVWSLNEREARLPTGCLELRMEAGDHTGACEALSGWFGTVLVRVGRQGSWLSDGGAAHHIPSIPVTPAGTNGVGDACSGVLTVALARGVDLTTALC